jgi:hypothetical protein
MELDRVMAHQEWDMMEEAHLHLEEVEVVEPEELVMVHMMMVEDLGVLDVISQAMDLLNIIGREVEVLVGHTGILNHPQGIFIMVVMDFLVDMVGVEEVIIVTHSMELIGTV